MKISSGRNLLFGFLLLLAACVQPPAALENKGLDARGGYSRANPEGQNPFKVIVDEGDTVYTISKKYDVGTRDIIELNGLRPPYTLLKGQVVRLPKAVFHLVRKGDTVYAISRSYGVDMGRLVRVNNIEQPYTINVGTKLRLPFAAFEEDGEIPVRVTVVEDEEETDDMPNNRLQKVVAKDLQLLDEAPKQEAFVVPGRDNQASGSDVDANAPMPVLRANSYPQPQLKPGTQYAKASGLNEKYEPAAYSTYDAKQYSAKGGSSGFVWPTSGKVISGFGPKRGGLYNDGVNISAPVGTKIRAAQSGQVVYSGNELRGYGNLILIKHDNGYITAYAHSREMSVKKGDFVKKGQVIASIGNTGHVSEPQLHFSIRKGRQAVDPQKYLPATISMN